MSIDEVKQHIQTYICKVKAAGIPVEKVILFGSHAKGTAGVWSDIDTCIVSSTFGRNHHDELLTLMKLTDRETVDIEPHPMSPAELKDPWNPLAVEIQKYGIVI